MARRRRQRPDEKPNGYLFVFDKIDAMEKDLICHTVKPNFTVMDIVRMLITEEQISFLSKSFELLDRGYYAPKIYTKSHWLPGFGPVLFHIACEEQGLAVWKEEGTKVNIEAPVWPAFSEVLRQIVQIHAQWNKVRSVVKFFNDCNASASAVRYYWPSMGIFLGAGHAFHALKGTTAFREPSANPGPMIELFRETAGIVGMAKFLPEKIERKTGLQVSIADSPLHGIL